MLGRGGLFRQENMEKRKIMSVREWVELCNKEDFRAPAVEEIGLHARSAGVKPKVRKTRKKGDAVKAESSTAGPADAAIKKEPAEDVIDEVQQHSVVSPPPSDGGVEGADPVDEDHPEEKPKVKGRRVAQTRAARDASLADRAARDSAFLETFEPHSAWLPANTKATDYTPEFCQKLERHYWRNCGLGRPAWYGADTQGTHGHGLGLRFSTLTTYLLQVPCTQTIQLLGMSRTLSQHCPVSSLPQIRVFPGSTPHTFISACGERPSHGMSRIWIFSASITYILGPPNFGIPCHKGVRSLWSEPCGVSISSKKSHSHSCLPPQITFPRTPLNARNSCVTNHSLHLPPF